MTTPWWGTALGDLYRGAIRATQSKIDDTETTCYSKADSVRDLILETTQSTSATDYLNAAQQLAILLQTVNTACGLDIMQNFLDSRLSNMDFTLGVISNLLAQILTGWTTQDHINSGNTQGTIPLWTGLNAVWDSWNENPGSYDNVSFSPSHTTFTLYE